MGAGAIPLIALEAGANLIQGVDQSNQLHAQARATDENARLTDTQGAWDASASLRAARMQQGSDIASAAADGVGLTGSVADLIRANAIEAQMQAMNIRYQANQKARGLRIDAANLRQQGRSALVGGVFRAGAAALSGAHDAANTAKVAKAQALGTIPIPAASGGAATTDLYARPGKTVWW